MRHTRSLYLRSASDMLCSVPVPATFVMFYFSALSLLPWVSGKIIRALRPCPTIKKRGWL